jgi:glycogen operon protein
MLSHGDELGRTQLGNNNVYGQDNELSWVDWGRADERLCEFTARLTKLRAAHPIFRRRRFFHGDPVEGSPVADIAWLRRDGRGMTKDDWDADRADAIGVFLNGRGIPERDLLGEPIVDDSFLLLANPLPEAVTFTLPGPAFARSWQVVLDTAEPDRRRRPVRPAGRVPVPALSMLVLRSATK